MDQEYISTKTEINMMENGKKMKSMELELSLMLLKESILEDLKMEEGMEKESLLIKRQKMFIQDFGNMEINMDLEHTFFMILN